MHEQHSTQISVNCLPTRGKIVTNYKPEDLAFELLDIPEWRKHLSTHIVNAIIYLYRLFTRNRLLIVNEINLLFLAGTFLSPLLMRAGWYDISAPFYRLYSLFCLQRPSHSFFLVGYQMSMEVRMVFISAGYVVAGVGYSWLRIHFPLTQKRLSSWQIYAVLSLPMLMDVLSQTIGWRDSDWIWRGSTGFLFGLATFWYFYPLFEKTIAKITKKRSQISA